MTNWRDSAACLDSVDADFFPVRQGGGEYEAAREVCQGCQVAAVCLDDAMAFEGARDTGSRHGMRGGLDPAERATRYRATTRAEKATTAMTPSAARAAIAKAAAVIAVEEHCRDQRVAVATLTTHGHSAAEISRRLGISARQVGRYRTQARAGVA